MTNVTLILLSLVIFALFILTGTAVQKEYGRNTAPQESMLHAHANGVHLKSPEG